MTCYYLGKFNVRSPVNLNGVKKFSKFESLSKSPLNKFSLFAGQCPHHMSIHNLVYILIAHITITLIDPYVR